MWKATGIGFMEAARPQYARGPFEHPSGGLLRPAGPREAVAEAQCGDPDVGAGVRGLDHLAAADVHGDVIAPARTVEEEVTGLEIGDRNRRAVGVLGTRIVREGHAGLAPGPCDQPGAVEAAAGRLAAPDVGDAPGTLGPSQGSHPGVRIPA